MHSGRSRVSVFGSSEGNAVLRSYAGPVEQPLRGPEYGSRPPPAEHAAIARSPNADADAKADADADADAKADADADAFARRPRMAIAEGKCMPPPQQFAFHA
jgi:hypothetical protein